MLQWKNAQRRCERVTYPSQRVTQNNAGCEQSQLLQRKLCRKETVEWINQWHTCFNPSSSKQCQSLTVSVRPHWGNLGLCPTEYKKAGNQQKNFQDTNGFELALTHVCLLKDWGGPASMVSMVDKPVMGTTSILPLNCVLQSLYFAKGHLHLYCFFSTLYHSAKSQILYNTNCHQQSKFGTKHHHLHKWTI